MNRECLDIDRDGRESASETLRPDTKTVYLFEYAPFHIGVILVTVADVNRAQQRALRDQGALLDRAAQPNAKHNRGAGVGSGS